MLIALARIALHRAIEHVLELFGDPRRRLERARRRRRLFAMATQHLAHVVAFEDLVAGDEMIEERARAIDVAAAIARHAGRLLGRHVARRADRDALDGDVALVLAGPRQLGQIRSRGS